MTPYTKHVLANGLEVRIYTVAQMKTMETTAYIRDGRLYEKNGEEGLAHLVEHLVFRSTKNYPESYSLKEKVANVGGYINGRTGNDFVMYITKMRLKDTRLGLEAINELVFNSIITEESMNFEKNIVLNELKKKYDHPETNLAQNIFHKISNPNKLLQNYGELETQSVKKASVKQASAHYKKHYVIENMFINIASPLPEQEVLDMAKEIFTDTKHGEKQTYKSDFKMPGSNLSVYFEESAQRKVYFGFSLNTPGLNDKNRYKAHILKEVLCEEIYTALRKEQGLIYGVSRQMFTEKENSLMYVWTSINEDKILGATKQILDIIDSVKLEIKPTTFTKAVEKMLSYLEFMEEKPGEVMNQLSIEDCKETNIKNIDEMISIYDSFSIEEIREVANEYLKKENIRWAFLGSISEETKKEIKKILK